MASVAFLPLVGCWVRSVQNYVRVEPEPVAFLDIQRRLRHAFGRRGNSPHSGPGSQTRCPQRWDFPIDARSSDGLGRGIAWAVAPDFCEQMLPHFEEGRLFVDCHEIKDALGRAFATWSANHDLIHFHDISDRCMTGGESCEGLELYVQGMRPEDRGGSEAAYVEHTGFREGVRMTTGYNATAVPSPFGDEDGDGDIDGWNQLALLRSGIHFRT